MSLEQCRRDIASLNLCSTFPLSQAQQNLLKLPTSCNGLGINVCKQYVGPQSRGNEWDAASGAGDSECIRVAYKGDPGYCCVSDGNANVRPNPCFDSFGYTCNIDNRNVTGSVCFDPAIEYCSSASTTQALTSNWGTTYPPCLHTLDRWLVGDTTPFTVAGGEPIPANLYLSTLTYTKSATTMRLFNTLYTGWGFALGAPQGSPKYNVIEENIYSICNTAPGICRDMLMNYCSQYSSQDLVSNPNLVRWCGCYLPDSEYTKYVNQYQINKECSPLCFRSGNIPLVNPTGTTPITCNTSTCLIDSISINLLNTTVEGGINFSQLCGSCGEGTCTCIMENNTITGVNSSIGGSIDISQSCGSSVCYNDNPNQDGPNKIQINCQEGTGTTQVSAPVVNSPYDYIFPYAFIGFFILVILFLLVVWWNSAPKAPTRTFTYNPYLLYGF